MPEAAGIALGPGPGEGSPAGVIAPEPGVGLGKAEGMLLHYVIFPDRMSMTLPLGCGKHTQAATDGEDHDVSAGCFNGLKPPRVLHAKPRRIRCPALWSAPPDRTAARRSDIR